MKLTNSLTQYICIYQLQDDKKLSVSLATVSLVYTGRLDARYTLCFLLPVICGIKDVQLTWCIFVRFLPDVVLVVLVLENIDSVKVVFSNIHLSCV